MAKITKGGPLISICCVPGKLDYPLESPCYQNASFPVYQVLPNIYHYNLSISKMSETDFVPRYGIPCSGNIGYYLKSVPPENDSFYLLEDGSIYVNTSNTSISGVVKTLLGIKDYCLTQYPFEDQMQSVVFACPFDASESTASKSTLDIIYTSLVGISIPFLIITFLVYTILPELKNLPGLILRMSILSLVVVHTVFVIIFIYPDIICVYVIDIILQFGALSYCLWLNVMSFDIWCTFRSMQNSSKDRHGRKFLIYSIYVWGLSLLITGVGAIIDFIPNLPNGIIRPGLRGGCWFMDDIAIVIYLYGPIEIIIASNIVIFILTAIKIYQHAKSTAHHFKGQTDEKQRFKLYLKLFSVMGITEISHVICRLWKDIPPVVRFIIDIPGGLQGLNIFIIFVCKNNIIQLLLRRLGCRSFRLKKSGDIIPLSSPRNSSMTTCTTKV